MIAGDEEADACSKQGAAIIDRTPGKSLLRRRTLTDPPPCHCRIKEVYTKTVSWQVNCRAATTQRDAVLLTRLRAGNTPLLKTYANQIDTTVGP